MMDSLFDAACNIVHRRRFLQRTSAGLGIAALASLLGEEASAAPHFPAKVKNVIYLFMAGGPSHVDLFDPKPKLQQLHGKDIPRSILGEQRVTLMTRNQGSFKTASTPFTSSKQG